MGGFRRWSRGAPFAGILVVWAFAGVGCADGGPPARVGDGGLSGDAASDPRVLETHLVDSTVSAGDPIQVECRVRGEDGAAEPVADGVQVTYDPASLVDEGDDGAVAVQAGEVSVRCRSDELGLVDREGATLTIAPGPAFRVVTELDEDTVTAGEPVNATCRTFDAFGNAVDVTPDGVLVDPRGDGVSEDGTSVLIERSGDYAVTCDVPGSTEVEPALLQVLPALPAELMVAPAPDRMRYVPGDVVKVESIVIDRYGNRVEAVELDYEGPGADPVALARFRLPDDGLYTFAAEVTSPTDGDVRLRGSFDIAVNSKGPAIDCLALASGCLDGSDATTCLVDSASQPYRVGVEDPFGVQSVSIRGASASQLGDGSYEANVSVRRGMNFVDVTAVDEDGIESSRTCSFLSVHPDACLPESGDEEFLDDGVALRLDQEAVDDGGSPSALNSLDDVVYAAMNSQALKDLVDAGIREQNPINDGGCGLIACNPDVDYTGGLDWGDVDSSLQLIPSGLRVDIVLPDVEANVEACGTTCCIGGSNITVTADSVEATVDLSLELQDGLLRAGVQGDPSVSVNGVGLDGSGFCGFLIDLLEGWISGTVRDAVRDALGDYLRDDVGPLLDDLVSSLDISTLGTSFDVPRLDGSGSVSVGLGLSVSSLDIVSERLLVGLGTRLTSTAAHARPSCGVFLPTSGGSVLLDPQTTSEGSPVAASVHVGILNQALHALWRGGFFDLTLDAGGTGDLPSGTEVTLVPLLPPVAQLAAGVDGEIEIMLGGVRASVLVPGLVDPPLTVSFGAVARASVSLSGDELVFGGLTLSELHVSFENDSTIPQEQRDVFEDLLADIAMDLLAQSLDDALPAVPLPAFVLPDSLADFGLPAGEELGVVGPGLSTEAQHFVLTGSFGIR
ncbi:MAG: hypothetical protein ACODAU_07820 [Myxococcota bacterium]